ncbi:MAG: DNA translocase FtsK 4TM domain-containing protein, partial [Proteobacteria bacterium]|nr:DNA translocase FtsK 4TM domain-containing protein [Pseudomonadota bacterium]
MTQHLRPERRITLLPAGAPAFLRRRVIETAGLALAFAGALLALALASYDPGDPSWSTATGRGARNLIGMPGASVADLSLQVLGFAAGLAPLLLIAWAWRLFSHRGLPRLWWNLTAVPFALLLAAAFAASLPAPAAWPLDHGIGGWIGDELFRIVVRQGAGLLPMVPLPAWQTLLAALAGVV